MSSHTRPKLMEQLRQAKKQHEQEINDFKGIVRAYQTKIIDLVQDNQTLREENSKLRQQGDHLRGALLHQDDLESSAYDRPVMPWTHEALQGEVYEDQPPMHPTLWQRVRQRWLCTHERSPADWQSDDPWAPCIHCGVIWRRSGERGEP